MGKRKKRINGGESSGGANESQPNSREPGKDFSFALDCTRLAVLLIPSCPFYQRAAPVLSPLPKSPPSDIKNSARPVSRNLVD